MIENNYFTIPLKEHNFNVYTYLILQMKKMDKHNEIDKMSARRSIIELKETKKGTHNLCVIEEHTRCLLACMPVPSLLCMPT